MSPKEKPSFYLYSIGYSPELITLGTLVYRNYANPDHRCISFPRVDENILVGQNLASITNVSGCWASTKSSKYGLGLQLLELASVTAGEATSLRKIVLAEKGRRVLLKDPVKFFEDRVLQNPDIRAQLVIWLTASKGSLLFKTATFQKPKVYFVTGFYELSGVRARIGSSRNINGDVGVSAETLGAATGIPIGLHIGPFSDKKFLQATIAMPETGIWAARFHQLDVGYVRKALEGQTNLPTTIRLRPDVTTHDDGLMAGTSEEGERSDDDEVLVGPGVQLAAVARLRIDDWVEEMDEDCEDGDKYDLQFGEAERAIKEDAEASDEDNV